jgi:hypothetical protein
MKKFLNIRFLSLLGIIILAIITRLFYHIPNVTPIMAIALFGAAYFSDKRLAFILPLLIMFISDILIGFHSTMFAVYISFALGVLIGTYLLKSITLGRIILSSLFSSIIFFIVTNFGVWLSGWYPFTFDGFVKCYIMAIPFFRYEIFGDLVYCGVLFGGFAFALRYVPQLAKSEKTI